MDYDEVYKKYQQLLEENQRLKATIDAYRSRLGLPTRNLKNDSPQIQPCPTDNPSIQSDRSETINNKSSPDAKIKLFMALFKGRDDVYAQKWYSRAGKSGYSPVCLNEWNKDICKKPQIKCSSCNNKNFAIWSTDAVDDHLRGKTVLGIYPLLKDESCYFLAIDFDDDGWKEDVTTLRKTCREKNIPVAIERSQSGSGAHAWFFFADKISAVAARKFGSALLTSAMARRHQIRFNSYDQLFPNQDTMPKGGFGNLIALPLQKQARQSNNSVFIDENFQLYDDQWSFLNSICTLSESEIHAFTQELSKGSELGELRQEENEESTPWIREKKGRTVKKKDFPRLVHITRADMLYICKKGISENALNVLKRLAAFRNPAFYKSQTLRLPTWNKPRIISLSDESPEYLHLPRGCEADLVQLFNTLKIDIEWLDERFHGIPIEVEFNGQLRNEQEKAIESLVKYDNGVLSATTAFGKTVIAAKMIAEKKVNTLILVHTLQLLEQWKKRLTQFLMIGQALPDDRDNKKGMEKRKNDIGQIGGGKNSLTGKIDIAVMQSLVKGDEVKESVRNYGMVIVDECHHVPAFSFEQILRNVAAKYVYGLTATPARQDGHHPIIFMQCGPIRYKVDPREQAKNMPFDHYVIPRFTPFRKPVNKDEKDWTIGEIYTEIGTNPMRNQLIIDDVLKRAKDGRNSLVLTQRTAHVEILARALQDELPVVITLTGSLSAKERQTALETLARLPAGSNIVIVATGKFVGEGFDEPRLDTLFLAMPIAWKGTVQQYAGRLHRMYRDKNEVQIYDYVDVHVGVLERMYQKRLRGYASIGYSIKGDSEPIEAISSIFDNTNFFSVFHRDVQSAKHEIVIVSPFLREKRLSQMLSLLADSIHNGVKTTIVTRPGSDYRADPKSTHREMIQWIKNAGVNLILKSQIHQKVCCYR